MGLWDKIKGIGSKIVKGIQSGISWVRDKAAPVIKKVWKFAKPAINALVPGGQAFTSGAEHIAGKIGDLIGVK